MDTFVQPKITGYRQLTPIEAELMNEAKALAEQCGALITRLRKHPCTLPDGPPHIDPQGVPSIDFRWLSIGATELQQGFMAVIRSIAQPTTF